MPRFQTIHILRRILLEGSWCISFSCVLHTFFECPPINVRSHWTSFLGPRTITSDQASIQWFVAFFLTLVDMTHRHYWEIVNLLFALPGLYSTTLKTEEMLQFRNNILETEEILQIWDNILQTEEILQFWDNILQTEEILQFRDNILKTEGNIAILKQYT